MSNSIIRVFVPLIVGFLTTFSFFRGVNEDALQELLVALITGVYYLIARLLEHYVSGSFGWLLGKPTPPLYLDKNSTKEIEDK
jgi:hypothetical protein